jgi:hypothetical protein
MGFNVEQYEMYDNDGYSNAGGCGILHPFNKGKREACEQAKKGSNAATSADTALSKGAVCVKGTPIYTPAFYLLTSKDKRTQNRQICQARKEAKIKDDVPPIDAVRDNPINDAQAPMDSTLSGSSSDKSSTSNTMMYVGIGAGILLLGIVAIILIKRK